MKQYFCNPLNFTYQYQLYPETHPQAQPDPPRRLLRAVEQYKYITIYILNSKWGNSGASGSRKKISPARPCKNAGTWILGHL